jgi:hypothetical protein
MGDDNVTAAGANDGAKYSYPSELARFVCDRWTDVLEHAAGGELPLDAATLEHFFSASYQASLLREEERPVTFRAVLASPACFPAEGIAPESLQRLEFSRAFPFDATELRRLSVAADTQRTLIGVGREADGALRIWGLVSSGSRWLRDVQGGRRAGAPLPAAPVIHVDAPGSMAVYKGYQLIAKLERGRLSGSRADPFISQWLPEQFSLFREELLARHELAAKRMRDLTGETWASLEPSLPRRISERMMKRVIALVRDARHGGTIIFLPVEHVDTLLIDDPYIDIKYQFAEGATRRSFPYLVVAILNRLAQFYGTSDPLRHEAVSWREFEAATDDVIETLDQALFETAHLIAGLASADGAVVMNKQHDLVGFGGMISGRLPAVRSIARALDLEGDTVAEEQAVNVGTRHRSAYRLAGALPGAVVIVISQDGGVRFVAQKGGRVTYWEQE